MKIKFKGFDQITAWVGGIGLAAIIFTAVWYTSKNVAKNMEASNVARLEQIEKDVDKLSAKAHETLAQKTEAQSEDSTSKSTEHNIVGKPSDTLEAWGYSGNLAPWYWASLNERWSQCGGKQNQSPIDISGAKIDERLKSLKINYQHGVTQLTLHHETVQGDIEHGSYIEWDGERFDLTRVFFRTPSEHRVNSLPWEMEVQLEHKSLTEKVIMLAVLVTPGSRSGVIDGMAESLPRYKDEIIDHSQLNWSDLLPSKKTYWKYVGSSTIPPCAPDVTWLILTETTTASKKAIDKFVVLQKSNVRPVFSIGKRELRRSNR